MPYLNRTAPDPEPMDCRILTAALTLFVENGYHNVSVHDVQKSANVSIGSIYKHFGGKEGIAKKLYYHLLNEMDELVSQAIKEKSSAKERCEEIIRLIFSYTETERKIIAFIFQPNHKDFLPDEPPIYSASPFRRMREIIRAGMDHGEIREMPTEIAASAIFGVAIHMVQLRLEGIIEQALPGYLNEVISSVWNGILITDEPSYHQENNDLLDQEPALTA